MVVGFFQGCENENAVFLSRYEDMKKLQSVSSHPMQRIEISHCSIKKT